MQFKHGSGRLRIIYVEEFGVKFLRVRQLLIPCCVPGSLNTTFQAHVQVYVCPLDGSTGVPHFFLKFRPNLMTPLSRLSGNQGRCKSSDSGDFYNPTGRKMSLWVYKTATHISSCDGLLFTVYFLVSTFNSTVTFVCVICHLSDLPRGLQNCWQINQLVSN
jgi:hypothetical protein